MFHHALPLAGLDKKTEGWLIVVVALNPQKQMYHTKYDEGFASEEEDCGFAKRDQEGGDRKNDDHFDQLIKEQDTGEVDISEQESNSAAIVESLGTSRHLSSGGVSLVQGFERRKNEASDTDRAEFEGHGDDVEATPSVNRGLEIRMYAVQKGTPEYYELYKWNCTDGMLGCRICYSWMERNNWFSHIKGRGHIGRWRLIMSSKGEPQETEFVPDCLHWVCTADGTWEPSIIRPINMEFLKSKNPKTMSRYKADAEPVAEIDQPLSVCAESTSGAGDGFSPSFPFNVSEPTSFDSLEQFVSSSERFENDTVDTIRSGIERHSIVSDATSSFVQSGVAVPIECHAGEWFCDVCKFYMRSEAVNDHLRRRRHRNNFADWARIHGNVSRED